MAQESLLTDSDGQTSKPKARSSSANFLLDGLNESQIAAVTSETNPVVVLAGAGSGKTRVLTRRVAWRILNKETDPRNSVVLTFTRKSADDLGLKLRQLGLRDQINAGTFHALALRQLQKNWAEQNKTAPVIVPDKMRLLRESLSPSQKRHALTIMTEIDWARAQLIQPETYFAAAQQQQRTTPLAGDEIAEAMNAYRRTKKRKNVIDYDDLLELAISELHNRGDYAAAVRWQHRHFYVDEFQDVNPAQYTLLKHWLGDSSDLFVVGDPNQAIYGWNGADTELLNQLASPSAKSNVVRLVDNYRSSPEIVRTATSVLPSRPGYEAHQMHGPAPTLTSFSNATTEAEAVAASVAESHGVSKKWSDHAVLARTRKQLETISEALTSFSIPHKIRQATTTPSAEEVSAGEQASTNAPTFFSQADEAEPDEVYLCTFHSAKGLEWPSVHVVGLEDGFVPISYAKSEAQLAEETRLLYVALTRAMTHLHMSWSESRDFGTSTMERKPAPQCSVLRAVIDNLLSQPHETNWREKLSLSRQVLDESLLHGEPNNASNSKDTAAHAAKVLADLEAWRERKARASQVPKKIVATNQVLEAVSKTGPTTIEELSACGLSAPLVRIHGDELLAIIAGQQ